MPSIEFELPLMKQTKNRVKYGTEDREAWKTAEVGGHLYPLTGLLIKAFGKLPAKVKVTIEEA